MATDNRDFEIVLWGATGFTGRLVAEHFAERYDESELDWAIAGRNREKLEAVRDDLTERNPDWGQLDTLVGDALDRERLDEITERTQVVCATVGPYAKYGLDLVESCLKNNTDYCDLSGELYWIRRMIDEYHDHAREQGVRIVHACGFDSIPSDLGTLLVQTYANETFGTVCSTIRTFVTTSSLRLSGGTIAGMVETYEEMDRNSNVRQILDDPYSLIPNGKRSGPNDGRQRWPRYDSSVDQWTAPFIMAVINEKIVHRSNALLDHPWGQKFHYSEVQPTGDGLTGAAVATVISSGLILNDAIMSVSPLRNLVDRFVLPDPGEGPSRQTIEGSTFNVRLLGTGRPSDSEREFTVEAEIAGDRDPYGASAWMVGESAMCLATGETQTPLDGGVLTPASGIGTPLVDRLSNVGLKFTVKEKNSQ